MWAVWRAGRRDTIFLTELFSSEKQHNDEVGMCAGEWIARERFNQPAADDNEIFESFHFDARTSISTVA